MDPVSNSDLKLLSVSMRTVDARSMLAEYMTTTNISAQANNKRSPRLILTSNVSLSLSNFVGRAPAFKDMWFRYATEIWVAALSLSRCSVVHGRPLLTTCTCISCWSCRSVVSSINGSVMFAAICEFSTDKTPSVSLRQPRAARHAQDTRGGRGARPVWPRRSAVRSSPTTPTRRRCHRHPGGGWREAGGGQVRAHWNQVSPFPRGRVMKIFKRTSTRSGGAESIIVGSISKRRGYGGGSRPRLER